MTARTQDLRKMRILIFLVSQRRVSLKGRQNEWRRECKDEPVGVFKDEIGAKALPAEELQHLFLIAADLLFFHGKLRSLRAKDWFCVRGYQAEELGTSVWRAKI